MKGMRLKRGRVIVSLVLSSLAFALINYRHFHRTVSCWDCFFPYGLPFTFFKKGGFAGGGGIVWRGVLLDLLTVLAGALIIGLFLQLVRRWTYRAE